VRALLDFKAQAISADGRRVDYAKIRSSEAYRAFQRNLLPQLRAFAPTTLPDRKHRLAFWINLYNALVIDAVIRFSRAPAEDGARALAAFFRQAAYHVGGQRLSCDDIEHGILRANRGHPFYPGPQFAADDPRRRWTFESVDPRIHFALNCASCSCPPIGVYRPERLDEQLDAATRNFVAQEVRLDTDSRQVFLSSIFRWYLGDFGGREGLRAFLVRYLPSDAQQHWDDTFRWRFTPYNWHPNGSL